MSGSPFLDALGAEAPAVDRGVGWRMVTEFNVSSVTEAGSSLAIA
jgi:hypothetical protein